MIKFVRINNQYIQALKNVDSKVQSNSPEDGKDLKPYVGVLFQLDDGIQYFVPLSSPKAKHYKMKNGSSFHKVYNKQNKLRAVINFNNMVPVVQSLYVNINFKKDIQRFLLQEEYEYCRENEETLKNKAKSLYKRYLENKLTPKEQERTCDFKKLEETLEEYVSKQGENDEES